MTDRDAASAQAAEPLSPCPTCGAPRALRTVRVSWAARLALVAVTFAAFYFGPGPRMTGMLEGVAHGYEPAIPTGIVALLVAALSFVAGFVRLRRPLCARCAPGWLFVPLAKAAPAARGVTPSGLPATDVTGRRRFLAAAGAVAASLTATAVAGAGGLFARINPWRRIGRDIFFAEVERTAPVQRPEWAGATVKSYRALGRTGAFVSDISLGSGAIEDVQVAIRALERGITYFDTAPDYSHTGSEQLLGRAIREHGGRDRIFLASKFCTADGHLPPETPVPEIIRAVEGSLTRLGTDHLDLIHIHSCDRVERLLAPTFHEAFDRLKEQGKTRFLGVSTHTPHLEQVARAAIDSGRFDVMMLAYHHGIFTHIGELIDEAHGKGIGVVAMKTLKGAKAANLAGFRDDASAYSQAAFRWVLSNPSVSCLVVSFSKLEHCDEYLYASGAPPHPADHALLERYDRLASGDYCRPHCGACLDSCVNHLPIDTVLRYDMYFADYGREAAAREKYARLSAAGLDASSCAACPAPCAGACPFELPIRAKMVRAHERLRSSA